MQLPPDLSNTLMPQMAGLTPSAPLKETAEPNVLGAIAAQFSNVFNQAVAENTPQPDPGPMASVLSNPEGLIEGSTPEATPEIETEASIPSAPQTSLNGGNLGLPIAGLAQQSALLQNEGAPKIPAEKAPEQAVEAPLEEGMQPVSFSQPALKSAAESELKTKDTADQSNEGEVPLPADTDAQTSNASIQTSTANSTPPANTSGQLPLNQPHTNSHKPKNTPKALPEVTTKAHPHAEILPTKNPHAVNSISTSHGRPFRTDVVETTPQTIKPEHPTSPVTAPFAEAASHAPGHNPEHFKQAPAVVEPHTPEATTTPVANPAGHELPLQAAANFQHVLEKPVSASGLALGLNAAKTIPVGNPKEAKDSGKAEASPGWQKLLERHSDLAEGQLEVLPVDTPHHPVAEKSEQGHQPFAEVLAPQPENPAPVNPSSENLSSVAVNSTPTASTSIDSSNSTSTLPTFLSSAEHLNDQVVEGTAYSVKNGHKELVLKINPHNLGEVRINLVSHGNQELSARLIASSSETHELLQNQVQTLRDSLEAQGIKVERLQVVLAGGSSAEHRSDFANNSHNGQQNFQQSEQQQQSSQQQQDSHQQAHNPWLDGQGNLPGRSAFGHSHNPNNNHYASVPNHGANSATEPHVRDEASQTINNDGRISILA